MLKSNRMKIAREIMSIIDEKMTTEDDTLWLESYANGREQGYNIWNAENDRRVSFAEHRNSGDIVIYRGIYQDFSMQGNTPNDAAYKNSVFVDINNPYQAASSIVYYLRERT